MHRKRTVFPDAVTRSGCANVTDPLSMTAKPPPFKVTSLSVKVAACRNLRAGGGRKYEVGRMSDAKHMTTSSHEGHSCPQLRIKARQQHKQSSARLQQYDTENNCASK